MSDPAEGTIVNVENAEAVNAPPPQTHLPYVKIIAGISFALLAGFTCVTFYVLIMPPEKGIDAATKGAMIQAWINIAVSIVSFWVGSSLGGKMTAQPTEKK